MNIHIHYDPVLTLTYYNPPHVRGGVDSMFLTLSIRVPVRPSIRSKYVRPFVLRFLSITYVFYKRISFKFCICICSNNYSLGIINGKISMINHRVMALVNVQKMVFGL